MNTLCFLILAMPFPAAAPDQSDTATERRAILATRPPAEVLVWVDRIEIHAGMTARDLERLLGSLESDVHKPLAPGMRVLVYRQGARFLYLSLSTDSPQQAIIIDGY
jgi:hypothetical protein